MLYAITNAHVVPIDGSPFDGTVIVRDGRIEAAGTGISIPEGATEIDAHGQWLLPGLVDAHTHVGIWEEGENWAGNDTNEVTDPVTASVRALDAINPDDIGFTDALSGGVTCVNVLPGSANVIGGLAIAISTRGRVVDEMVLKHPSGLKAALGENPKRFYGDKGKAPSTRLGIAQMFRDMMFKTREYMDKKDAGDTVAHNMHYEHLAMVLRGDIPLRQHAHRADDIVTAHRMSEEFGYDLIIEHGTEGHHIADKIAQWGIPVLYGPLMTNRSKTEVRRQSMAAPHIYHEAGVDVGIITDHPIVPIEYLITQVAFAVREGLSEADALKMVTTMPARILGLGDELGSITAGKRADLALWSGNPLDISSRVTDVWVAGEHAYTYDEQAREGHAIEHTR